MLTIMFANFHSVSYFQMPDTDFARTYVTAA